MWLTISAFATEGAVRAILQVFRGQPRNHKVSRQVDVGRSLAGEAHNQAEDLAILAVLSQNGAERCLVLARVRMMLGVELSSLPRNQISLSLLFTAKPKPVEVGVLFARVQRLGVRQVTARQMQVRSLSPPKKGSEPLRNQPEMMAQMLAWLRWKSAPF